MISEDLLKILVCPACRNDLAYEPDVKLTCKSCAREYPIRNGIPIMLVEGAPSAEDAEDAEEE